jgi:hypothetical protein
MVKACTILILVAALCSEVRAETIHQRLFPADPHVRAGHPQQVHRWAKPTITPKYCFGYVGGGAVLGGQPRTLEEGTWGMDYCGHWLPHRVWLNWYHGRVEQGGSGRYETDGPKILKKP